MYDEVRTSNGCFHHPLFLTWIPLFSIRAGTVSAITTSLTAAVGLGAMIVAAYHLEQTTENRLSDLEAIPDDIEVKEADDKASHLKECYEKATQWNALPRSAKILLLVSLACIVTACYIVQLFSNLSFVPHSLTDSINENLGGKVTGLFLPLGMFHVLNLKFCVCRCADNLSLRPLPSV